MSMFTQVSPEKRRMQADHELLVAQYIAAKNRFATPRRFRRLQALRQAFRDTPVEE